MGLNDHEYLGIQKYPPDMYKHYWNICLYMSGHTNIMGSNNHMCLGIQKYPDAYKHHGNVYSYVQADVIHVWATNKYLYIDGHTPYMYNCLDCHTPYMYNCSFSWMGIQEFIYNAYGTWQTWHPFICCNNDPTASIKRPLFKRELQWTPEISPLQISFSKSTLDGDMWWQMEKVVIILLHSMYCIVIWGKEEILQRYTGSPTKSITYLSILDNYGSNI